MKLYILASLIIFIAVIMHNLRKSKRIRETDELSFWERERLANETRRKSLDDLDYIHIPLEELPMSVLTEDETVASCLETIQNLSLRPIVNLTGLSNTDLKLKYGTANITALIEYDQSYTLLASTLQQWAALLFQSGFAEETRQILEFAVSTRTDVSASYDLLAKIYLQNGETDKIPNLVKTAEELNSLNKDVILRHLQALTDPT